MKFLMLIFMSITSLFIYANSDHQNQLDEYIYFTMEKNGIAQSQFNYMTVKISFIKNKIMNDHYSMAEAITIYDLNDTEIELLLTKIKTESDIEFQVNSNGGGIDPKLKGDRN